MKRPITGYGVDQQGDWFAVLACGHPQHVRHQPPFINRPWVTTTSGRKNRLGHELNCLRCDRLELPDSVVADHNTAEFTSHDISHALMQSLALGTHMWLRVIVTQGILHYRAPALDVNRQLDAKTAGVIPPRLDHQLTPIRTASFYFETYRIPAPAPVTPEAEAGPKG